MINLNFLYLYSTTNKKGLKTLSAKSYLEMQAFTEEKKQNLGQYYQGLFIERASEIMSDESLTLNNIDTFLVMLKHMGGDIDKFISCISKTSEADNIVDRTIYSIFPESRVFGAMREFRERGNTALFQNAKVMHHLPYKIISQPNYLFQLPTINYGYEAIYNALKQLPIKNNEGHLSESQIVALCLAVKPIILEKSKNEAPQYIIDNLEQANNILNIFTSKSNEIKWCEFRDKTYIKYFNGHYNQEHWDLHEDAYDGLFSIDETGENYNFDTDKTYMIDFCDMVMNLPKQQVEKAPQEQEFTITKDSVDAFKGEIIGQDFAKEQIVDKLLATACGFVSQDKPIATFLLSGPTGVGKTETAKALAKNFFGGRIYTIDMTNFKNSADIAILTGSAPGYVGYDDKNPFVEYLKNNPSSVLLFDEIDKAASGCLPFLMRMLDEGKFSTAKGEEIDVSQCAIIATTNQKANIKKNSPNKNLDELTSLSGEAGSPFLKEFMGRFDGLIEYNSLTKEDLGNILRQKLDKRIAEFEAKRTDGVHLSYSDRLIQDILSDASVLNIGARALNSGIQNSFIRPISYYLLENKPCKEIQAIGQGQLLVDGKKVKVFNEIKKEKPKAEKVEAVSYIS